MQAEIIAIQRETWLVFPRRCHSLSSVRTRLASIWYCHPSPLALRNWIPCSGSQGTCHPKREILARRVNHKDGSTESQTHLDNIDLESHRECVRANRLKHL